MLPSFTVAGVLPPFQPERGPQLSAGRSPYRAKPEDLVAAFATSPARRSLLRDLLQHRSQLRTLGLRAAFQWIDGSFLENVEHSRGRPPGDIDLVTFFSRPEQALEPAAWREFMCDNWDVFHPPDLQVDCHYVDMSISTPAIIDQTAYWHGLFSHQRTTALWKGIVQLDLDADDSKALRMIGGKDGQAT